MLSMYLIFIGKNRLCFISNDRPMIEMTIPSSLDPTLAPEGHHVVQLFTQYTPYTLADGKTWTDEERNKYADTGICLFKIAQLAEWFEFAS